MTEMVSVNKSSFKVHIFHHIFYHFTNSFFGKAQIVDFSNVVIKYDIFDFRLSPVSTIAFARTFAVVVAVAVSFASFANCFAILALLNANEQTR